MTSKIGMDGPHDKFKIFLILTISHHIPLWRYGLFFSHKNFPKIYYNPSGQNLKGYVMV